MKNRNEEGSKANVVSFFRLKRALIEESKNKNETRNKIKRLSKMFALAY